MDDWLQGLEDDAQYDPELYGGYDEEDPEPDDEEEEPEQPKTTRLANGHCSTWAGWYMGPYGGIRVDQHSREADAARELTRETERGTTLHNDGDEVRGTLARITRHEAKRLGLHDEHVAVVCWEHTDPTKHGYEARHLSEKEAGDLEKAFDVQAPAPPGIERKAVAPGGDSSVAPPPQRLAAAESTQAGRTPDRMKPSR